MAIDCVSDFGPLATTIYLQKYSQENNGVRESWADTAKRQVKYVVDPYLPKFREKIEKGIVQRKFMPGGRYLYAVGRRIAQVNNCFLFRAEDSREGWAELGYKVRSSLMTGGGIGVNYSKLREENSPVKGMGGFSTGPLALMNMTNEEGRYIRQGGSRRSAIWAGLNWLHPDIFKFIKMKNWPEWVRQKKSEDYLFPAPMDGTNISVCLDDEFFNAYKYPTNPNHTHARRVYWMCIANMLQTGEPGFTVDIGNHAGEDLRNACTEVCSADDSDMCNLGSLNMARFNDIDEFTEAVEYGTAFLVCGSLYSMLPIQAMHAVRKKNRRLGLGLMGVHEWLLRRGLRYGPDKELTRWLNRYAQSTHRAIQFCDQLGISRPIATRAIAPNGTIGIIAETTTAAEPIESIAYKRRYLKGNELVAQYVINPTAKRLIDSGIPPSKIESAFTLAEEVERRISMQAYLQGFVDQGISSTINLPAWGSHLNNEKTIQKFGDTLMTYLPKLRGITVYPDGSRSGQPIVPVPYDVALSQVGIEFIDDSDKCCRGGVCGE